MEDQWPIETSFLASDVFDPTLRRFVLPSDADGNLSIRQVADRRSIVRLPGFGHRLHNVWPQFSPNGQYLAVQYWFDARTVQSVIWDLDDADTGHALHLPAQVRCLAFSPDSRQIAGGWPDNSIRVFHLADRTTHTVAKGQGVTHLAFRADGQQLAFTSFEQKEVCVVELEHDEIVGVFQHPAELLSIAWSPDGCLLAAGCDDRKTYVWNTRTTRQQSVLHGHQKQVHARSSIPRARF